MFVSEYFVMRRGRLLVGQITLINPTKLKNERIVVMVLPEMSFDCVYDDKKPRPLRELTSFLFRRQVSRTWPSP